jgi:aryl-alcohol dehydrogenase-like predicted oxidoreductase
MREKAVILSKSGVSWHANKRVNMTNDPTITSKMLEQSLRDLATEYIDIYMIHWPDKNVDIRLPLEILQNAKEQQKIRHIGLCNTNLADLQKSADVCEVAVVQAEHNYFNQGPLTELGDYLKEHHIGFMNWGTLDKGILTGQVNANRLYEKSDCRSWAPWWNKKEVLGKIAKVEALKSELKNQSLLEFALQFNLSHPLIASALCGFRSKDQLDSILESLNNLEINQCIDSKH